MQNKSSFRHLPPFVSARNINVTHAKNQMVRKANGLNSTSGGGGKCGLFVGPRSDVTSARLHPCTSSQPVDITLTARQSPPSLTGRAPKKNTTRST